MIASLQQLIVDARKPENCKNKKQAYTSTNNFKQKGPKHSVMYMNSYNT
jgi:hypothetical protein